MENRLIERIKNGDKDALVKVYAKYDRYIIRSIRHSFPRLSKEDARSIYHATLIDFKKNIESGKLVRLEKAQLKTYLRTIAWRKATRHAELQKRRQEIINEVSVNQENQPNSNTEKTSASEQKNIILKILDTIDADCKEILELFYFSGLDSGEIAAEKGTIAQNIRKKKQRCIEKIKAQFKTIFSKK